MKTPDGRSANIDTIQGSVPLANVPLAPEEWLEQQFDKERDHERANLNQLVGVAEKAMRNISASSQRAADVAEKASCDIAAVLNCVQEYCVLTANSGTERARYLASSYGNGDSHDMGVVAADTSDGLFGGFAGNDGEAAANKSSDSEVLFGSSGVASCPTSPTIATGSMNGSTAKGFSFFGGNDKTRASGLTGGFTFVTNAAESTPAPTASSFPTASGGTRTTSGRQFTFGASMAVESTQSPTASPFPTAAGGTRTTSGRPFTFGASMAAESTQSPTASPFPTAAGGTRTTSGRPFTFGASTAVESSQAPAASTFTTAAGVATFNQGTENKATFGFGANAGAEFTPKPWIPSPSYYNRTPIEVPLEELNFNSALAHRVPASSPPSTTSGFGKKRRRRGDDDGPSATKRMK